MDPDANLKEQRELCEWFMTTHTLVSVNEISGRAHRLAELAQALDTWLSSGGFPPEDWRRK